MEEYDNILMAECSCRNLNDNTPLMFDNKTKGTFGETKRGNDNAIASIKESWTLFEYRISKYFYHSITITLT